MEEGSAGDLQPLLCPDTIPGTRPLMAAPRRFDHDKALRWHIEEGMSIPAIARWMGVSDSSVRRVCDPSYRERSREAMRRNGKRGACIGCGKTIWRKYLRCPTCAGLAQATTVRPDTLRCSGCGEWKPDNAFPPTASNVARRNRHSVCRLCDAERHRQLRARRAVPCTRCGKPRCSSKDKQRPGRQHRDTGLCVRCYHAALRRVGGITHAREIAA